MEKFSKSEVADYVGIRRDQFKKNAKNGMYEQVIGPIGKEPNGWTFYTREQMEQLKEWYHGNTVSLRAIAMGGGVQSTAMLLMHLRERRFSPAPDCAIFIDLHWEAERTYENLRALAEEARKCNFPFHWIDGPSIREDLMKASVDRDHRVYSPPVFIRNSEGKKAQITRDCTSQYKIHRMSKELRKMKGFGGRKWIRSKAEVWLGITTDEAHRLNNNSPYVWIQNRFPLCDKELSRNDCETWLVDNRWPVPIKSACLGCPYKPNRDWLEMKNNRPEEFADVVEVDETIRHGFNNIHAELFLHQSLVPIKDAIFDKSNKHGFGNECAGVCNV